MTDALPVAAALELVHTYSLVHDDLPAMDDDDLRRGLPTNHRKFGEAVAILAGDALLTAAFFQIAAVGAERKIPMDVVTEVVRELAQAAGSLGMAGGQVEDIRCQRGPVADLDLATVEWIHRRKTGALIRASVRIGAIVGRAAAAPLAALTAYGESAGLAFQIADDLLDIEGDPERVGKRLQKDQATAKLTYPGVAGVEPARRRARELMQASIAAVAPLGPAAEPLRNIARYIVERAC